MSRSLWKGLFFSNDVILANKVKYKIKSRSSLIPSFLYNKSLYIYNGKQGIPLRFSQENISGHKLGEFSFIKKKCVKVKKEKKNFKLKK
jgi:ribosomal protein S19